jgi:hypothetical protein
MESVGSSETSVHFYQNIQREISSKTANLYISFSCRTEYGLQRRVVRLKSDVSKHTAYISRVKQATRHRRDNLLSECSWSVLLPLRQFRLFSYGINKHRIWGTQRLISRDASDLTYRELRTPGLIQSLLLSLSDIVCYPLIHQYCAMYATLTT